MRTKTEVPMSERSGEDVEYKRAYGNRHVGRLILKTLAAPARRRGFTEATLLNEWDRVVGVNLARRCQPVRIRFLPGRNAGAVLELRAPGGIALEIQHATPQIIERINQYFGRRAVRQLRIVQAPLPVVPQSVRAISSRPLREDERASIEAEVGTIDHGGLRASLAALGAAIRGSRPG